MNMLEKRYMHNGDTCKHGKKNNSISFQLAGAKEKSLYKQKLLITTSTHCGKVVTCCGRISICQNKPHEMADIQLFCP